MEQPQPSLKLKTARTLKWNAIDRVSSQVIYAVVGVILANILSKTDFGLVGVLLIFQAFATIFIDSGFGAALLREKEPAEDDYSTVFWFNLLVSVGVYLLLFFCAPLIAHIFDNQQELIPMSKAMFLVFVINGLAIVQTNRLMKRMNVRMIAISNSLGLLAGGVAGIWLALKGFGAWAMIWQNIIMASVKTGILWVTGGWLPKLRFSKTSLRKIRAVGFSVFSSALLNTISQNIYNFIIGIFYSISSLGVYTQADKWSKMGSASISQILTASFVPLLSKVQDSRSDFMRYISKTGRFTSFILLPAMIGLCVIASPLFHLLFGNKWDAAIPIFQMLTARGIFIVLISLYNNYLLALGKSRHIFACEAVKDGLIFIAIAATIFFRDIDLLILGQLISGVATWIILLKVTGHGLDIGIKDLLKPITPFISAAAVMVIAALAVAIPFSYFVSHLGGCGDCEGVFASGIGGCCDRVEVFVSLGYATPQHGNIWLRILLNALQIIAMAIVGLAAYLVMLRKTPELKEAREYLFGRFRR